MAKYTVRVVGFGYNTLKVIDFDTLDELPPEIRGIIAMLDAMDMFTTFGGNRYAGCERGDKTVYASSELPGNMMHEAYYNVWDET